MSAAHLFLLPGDLAHPGTGEVQRILDGLGLPLTTCTDPAQVSAGSGPAVTVLGPGVASPLPAARRIARSAPQMRFVFAVDAPREAAIRREAAYAAPPGGRWSMLRWDDPGFADCLRQEIELAQQQRRLRTTLDRMTLATSAAPLPDAGEYRRLVASDRYLASVLRHAHDAIVSLDSGGRVVAWNRGAELLFGLTLEQAQRVEFVGLFRDPDAARGAVDAAQSGSYRTAGLEIERDGAVRYVDANFGVLRDDAAAAIGVVAILRDITERHRAEEELRASSRQKDEFLAMLAHELRNPLAPIRTATQVLAMLGLEDARACAAVDIIARQTEHMAGLIGDLLDIARVTRGAVVLEREALPVQEIVRDAVEQARASLDSRGHRLVVDDPTPGLHVFGDRKRLTQVLANLLVNAAKYTPPGGEVRLRLSGDAHDVHLAVEDTGIGMSPELRARVFDLFVQAERSPDRAEGGLGVGLSLVRSLVAMHGGTVSAHSEGEGRGSRFDVRLPRAKAQRGEPATPAPGMPLAATGALDVMVVDDNEDAAQTLGMLLQAMGHRVDVEIDPRSALRRTERRAPDVLILDIGMPHIDGYELARRIRALPSPRRPVLIALTGYGHPADRERARRAGFDHHLIKPLDATALGALLAQAQADFRAQATRAGAA